MFLPISFKISVIAFKVKKQRHFFLVPKKRRNVFQVEVRWQ